MMTVIQGIGIERMGTKPEGISQMKTWSLPGMLFIGDTAHNMSPVASQGINLPVRDSIVAANHLMAHRLVSRQFMPMFSVLGIRQHHVRWIQGGKTEFKVQVPVKLVEPAASL